MTAVIAVVAMGCLFVWGGWRLLRSLDEYNARRRQGQP